MKIFLKKLDIPKTNSYTYTDCEPTEDNFCSQINTDNGVDVLYIKKLKRDTERVKMPIYMGSNQAFKDWIDNLK